MSFNSTTLEKKKVTLKSKQMEKSLDEDKLILPDNGNYGGDWRSVGLRGVRSLSKVNMCEKSPVSTI